MGSRTHVVLPEELVTAIDALVGKRGRSSFLAEAGWQELKRRRLLKLLERSEPFWKDKDHPELRRGAAAWVDRLRRDNERPDAKNRSR